MSKVHRRDASGPNIDLTFDRNDDGREGAKENEVEQVVGQAQRCCWGHRW